MESKLDISDIMSASSLKQDRLMAATPPQANAPIYRQLTARLRAAIESGEYPVGGLLPTEVEISRNFGVSRHTVRDALRILSAAGMIQRRRRIGTVVTAKTDSGAFVQALPGFEELLQYQRDIRLMIDSYDGPFACPLSKELKLDPQYWVRIDGRRGPEKRLLGLTTVLMRRDYAPTKTVLERTETSLGELLEKSHGIVIGKIDQNIAAVSLDRQAAQILGAIPGAAALRARRFYYEQQGGLILASESIHPADRFSYTLSFTRSVTDGTL